MHNDAKDNRVSSPSGLLARRGFLRGAMLGGAAAAMRPAMAQPSEHLLGLVPLAGVCDLHVHAAPDTKPRLDDELGFARAFAKAGYRAVMFKSNDWSCHDRAYLLRRVVPGVEIFGSLCLNGTTGDRVNPVAVAKALSTVGGLCRCVWLPTQDATYPRRVAGLGGGIPVTDGAGHVLSETTRVMELCAAAGVALASGHCSPEEALTLARRAREVGLRRFVVTHANSHLWRLTHDQVCLAADLGAFVEFSYIANCWGPGTGLPDFVRQSDEDFCAYCALVPERSFVTTDLGQPGMPHPIEGMRRAVAALTAAGVSRHTLDLLTRNNPAHVAGLEA